MAQNDVLDYIRNTPNNSNVNVVKGMLNNTNNSSLPEVTAADNGKVLTVVEGEWDKAVSGDVGYECTESWVTLTEESVITDGSEGVYEGQLTYIFTSEPPETLYITFNGTKYECNRIKLPEAEIVYGGYGGEEDFDFSTYPFMLFISVDGVFLYTETAGTYSVKIETVETSVETTHCFENAVKYVLSDSEALIINDVDHYLDKTWQEIHDAFISCQKVIVCIRFETGTTYKAVTGVATLATAPDYTEYSVSCGNDDYITSTPTDYPLGGGE